MKKNKKKSVIKRKNTITLIVVILIVAVIILLGLYNVINRYLDNKNSNENEGVRPIFYADKMTNMDITIPGSSTDTQMNTIEYKVSLQNKSNNMSICKYNLYYYWDENPYGYYKTGNKDEITLSGKVNGKDIFKDIQLKDYNFGDLKTLLASYYIVNDGGEITNQSWEITSNFYGSNNQENILNQTYPGKIGVEEVACSKATYLKDEALLENNYICLGSNDEYCPEGNLFQVISATDEGIKVVRTKSYGVSSWSNDLLPRISESFLKNEGKNYSYLVIDYDWPLYDEEDLNIDMRLAYQHELNAPRKINTKVGLLSLSDYKSLSFLNDYETPYVILSDTGLVITATGATKSGSSSGFVYPVLYLESNAVVSKGDGSRGNPYFIN